MANSRNPQKDVSSFPTRISDAMQGDSGGLDVSMLAWEFSHAVDQANIDLKKCADLLGRGSSVDAYVEMMRDSNLMERVQSLNFPELDAWKECCASFGWKQPEDLNTNLIDCLKGAFEEGEKLKGWLMEAYRERRSSKNPESSLPIIDVLVDQFSGDHSLQKERIQMQKKMKLQAEADLMAISAGLMPGETAQSIIDRYEACGVELPKSDSEVKTVVKARKDKAREEAIAKVEGVINNARQLNESNWKQFEDEYLACQWHLDSKEVRELVEPASLEQVSKIGERLGQYRGEHDANLQLKDAIKVRDSGKGQEAKLAIESISKIRNLMEEKGYKISEHLQNQLDKRGSSKKMKKAKAPKPSPKARGEKKSSKTGLFAGIGIAAVAGAAAIWYLYGDNASSSQSSIAKSKPIPAKTSPAKDEKAKSVEKKPAKDPNASTSVAKQSETATPNAGSDVAQTQPAAEAPRKKLSVEETLKEVQRKLDAEYAAVADLLKAAVEKGYTPAIEEEVAAILEIIEEKATAASDNDETKAIAARIEDLKKTFEEMKSDRGAELATIAEYWKSQAESNVRLVEAAKERKDFEKTSAKADEVLAETWKAIERAQAIDPEYSSGALQLAEDRLRKTQEKWASLIEVLDLLASAKTMQEYIEPLESIKDLDIASAIEKEGAARILELQPQFAEMLQKLVLPESLEDSREFSIAGYQDTKITLSFSERAHLQKLIRSASETASVYKSKVRFYQGSTEPQSVKTVYLSKPIEKIDKKLEDGINHTFPEYGFDAEGRAADTPRGMNILSRPGGTAFGFYYEASTLSPESEYFANVIQPALNRIGSGARRFTAIELIESINAADSISPAFKAYWKGEILGLISKEPWKWGLKLSPTLQQDALELASYKKAGLDRYSWLKQSELESPSSNYAQHFEGSSELKPSEEVSAFISLLETATKGELVPVGFADLSGSVHYASKIKPTERLWTFNETTGQIERLEKGKKLSVYMPVVTYRLNGQDAGQVLAETSKSSGVELSSPSFGSIMPPLFAE